MKVLFFGELAEIVGKSSQEFNGFLDSDSLKTKLLSEFPKFSTIPFQIAVNQNLITENVALSDSDEIAFLPPFAGG
ncbi:MAG: MoaD/ThiS family protein [Bacteroidota bacterium]